MENLQRKKKIYNEKKNCYNEKISLQMTSFVQKKMFLVINGRHITSIPRLCFAESFSTYLNIKFP